MMPNPKPQPKDTPAKPVVKPRTKPEPVAPAEAPRMVYYPTLVSKGHYLGGEYGPLTVAQAKILLDWQTEEESLERWKEEHPDEDPSTFLLGWADGDEMLKDEYGKKVRCLNSENNRPFTLTRAKEYAQSILNHDWAGPCHNPGTVEEVYAGEPWVAEDGTEYNHGDPIVLPEATPNGEAIIIGRYGSVISGQHRLVALVLAAQLWELDKEGAQHWVDKWPDEPAIDTFVTFGVSESDETVQTIDNVRPRSDSDVIFTSKLFKGLGRKDRQIRSNMLAKAVGLLWKRTWAGSDANCFDSYKTTQEVLAFQDRHPRLIECVKHIAEENKDRAISFMGLSAGEAAAMMYLMATGNSDIADYESMILPGEDKVDFEYFAKAKKFWVEAVKAYNAAQGDEHSPLYQALLNLDNQDTGQKATPDFCLAVVAKAWGCYLEKKSYEVADISLDEHFVHNADGTTSFVRRPTFGGIDRGNEPPERSNGGGDPEAEKARIRREDAEKTAADARRKGNGKVSIPYATGGKAMAEQDEELHQRFPGHLLVYRSPKEFSLFGDDAHTLGKLLGSDVTVKIEKDMKFKAALPLKDFVSTMKRLVAAGNKVATADRVEKNVVCKVWDEADVPKLIPATRADVEAEQTAKARKADEEKAKEEANGKEGKPTAAKPKAGAKK